MRLEIIGILAFILISCGGDPTGEKKVEPEKSLAEVAWTQKEFHLDSRLDFSFKIYTAKKDLRLEFKMDKELSLDLQIANLEKLLAQTNQEFDIGLIRELEIMPNRNKELFSNFTQISSIDSCIRANEREGQRWVDMATVSDNAHKSKQLDKLVSVFRAYGLEPVYYQLEKCTYFNEGEKEGNIEYSMWCPFLYVKLKKAHNKA